MCRPTASRWTTSATRSRTTTCRTCWNAGRSANPKKDTDRTAKAFLVPAKEIAGNKYDLSINRYKEVVYEEEEYDPPKKILEQMKNLEKEIMKDMEELEGLLG